MEENRKHGHTGIAPPGAVSESVRVGTAETDKAKGLLGMTALASSQRRPAAPKLSGALRESLKGQTPALARGVREVAKRR